MYTLDGLQVDSNSIHKYLAQTTTQLIAVTENLVDRSRAPVSRSLGPLNPYPLNLSGEETSKKLFRVRNALSRLSKTDGWIYVLPTLPGIAWLLNYRCPSDIPYCPVAYAYFVLTPTRCAIFVDERKVQDAELRVRWDQEGLEVRPYGVEEVCKWVEEYHAEVRMKRGMKTDLKLYAPEECSWALSDIRGEVRLAFGCLRSSVTDYSSRYHSTSYPTRWIWPKRSRIPSNSRITGMPIYETDEQWSVLIGVV